MHVRTVGGGFHHRGELSERKSEHECDREFHAIVAMKLQLGQQVAERDA